MLAVVATGCGGGDSARERVDAYIQGVNAVNARFADDFETANQAYLAFSREELVGDEAIAALARARADMAEAQTELGSLVPPAEAADLHAGLLDLFERNLDFADETTALASYQQGSAAAIDPLGAVDARLSRELRRSDAPREQVRALERFIAGLRSAVRALRSLDVPRVLAPPHADQLGRLSRTLALARQLRQALRDQQAERVASLVKEFRAENRPAAGRKRVAARALKRYNRRYRKLSESYQALYAENARLDETLD